MNPTVVMLVASYMKWRFALTVALCGLALGVVFLRVRGNGDPAPTRRVVHVEQAESGGSRGPRARARVAEDRDVAPDADAPAAGGEVVPGQVGPGASASSNGTIGFSGPASSFPARRAYHRSARRPGGESARESVERALEWLASQQAADGRWIAAEAPGADRPQEDVALTGRVVLALLSAGDTHQTGPWKVQTKAGLKWLVSGQTKEGAFAPSTRSHALAALALVEAYGLTWSVVFKDAAQSGVNWLLATQRDDGSWSDSPDARTGQVAATADAALVLVVARIAELEIDDDALSRTNTWLSRQDPDVRHPTHVLAHVLSVVFANRGTTREDPSLATECERLLEDLLASPESDLAAWSDGATAAFQVGGATWTRWSEAFVRVALPRQCSEGECSGSWDPVRRGPAARIDETALRCLVLGAGHRYLRFAREWDQERPSAEEGR